MRVYVPATITDLRALVADAVLGPAPITAFAVTPGLREWYLDDDAEELEYAASVEAARASLRLLDSDEQAPRRRVVIAADVPDAQVEVHDDIDRGVVRVLAAVPLAAIASVHVDDAEAEAVVALAAEAVIAADLGDNGSQERVDDAEGFELSWYATQELETLLSEV